MFTLPTGAVAFSTLAGFTCRFNTTGEAATVSEGLNSIVTLYLVAGAPVTHWRLDGSTNVISVTSALAVIWVYRPQGRLEMATTSLSPAQCMISTVTGFVSSSTVEPLALVATIVSNFICK